MARVALRARAVSSDEDHDDNAPVPFGTFRPSERRAMIGSAFAAGCVCLMPGELAGAAICFVLTGALWIWHLRRSRKERSAA